MAAFLLMQQARREERQNQTQVAFCTVLASQAPKQKSNDWCKHLKAWLMQDWRRMYLYSEKDAWAGVYLYLSSTSFLTAFARTAVACVA